MKQGRQGSPEAMPSYCLGDSCPFRRRPYMTFENCIRPIRSFTLCCKTQKFSGEPHASQAVCGFTSISARTTPLTSIRCPGRQGQGRDKVRGGGGPPPPAPPP